jgi:hypothetical protein
VTQNTDSALRQPTNFGVTPPKIPHSRWKITKILPLLHLQGRFGPSVTHFTFGTGRRDPWLRPKSIAAQEILQYLSRYNSKLQDGTNPWQWRSGASHEGRIWGAELCRKCAKDTEYIVIRIGDEMETYCVWNKSYNKEWNIIIWKRRAETGLIVSENQQWEIESRYEWAWQVAAWHSGGREQERNCGNIIGISDKSFTDAAQREGWHLLPTENVTILSVSYQVGGWYCCWYGLYGILDAHKSALIRWVSVTILVIAKLQLKQGISDGLGLLLVLPIQVAIPGWHICWISGTISSTLIFVHILMVSGASSTKTSHFLECLQEWAALLHADLFLLSASFTRM